MNSYIRDFYSNPTIKSWQSYELIRTSVLAYSGTLSGIATVRGSKMRPSVSIERSCPTVDSYLWKGKAYARDIKALCKKYSKIGGLGYPLGFAKTGALIVFEHSCPNNCPQILWGTNERWSPLFYGKSVSNEAKATFPPEIIRRDPTSILISAGLARASLSPKPILSRPLPAEWLSVLSLFSKGVRRIDGIESITGMSYREAAELVEKCVSSGLISQKWRLTDLGHQELQASRKMLAKEKISLPKNEPQDYYPMALRNRKKC